MGAPMRGDRRNPSVTRDLLFDNLGPWSRLETLSGHEFLLVYTGTPSGTVEGRLRSLTTTTDDGCYTTIEDCCERPA